MWCFTITSRKTINLWYRANTENVYSGHRSLLVLWHRNEEDPALTRLDVHRKHQWKCCHCSVDYNSSHFWGKMIEICWRRLLSQIQKFKNVVSMWLKRRDTQVQSWRSTLLQLLHASLLQHSWTRRLNSLISRHKMVALGRRYPCCKDFGLTICNWNQLDHLLLFIFDKSTF